MTTATTDLMSQQAASTVTAPTLLSLVRALFGLNLRETLNAEAGNDQVEGAYHWGM